tara:strand:+ start:6354 stop:7247 length:894 start_codon:yes stop_codon:yes gene_type:complete
MNQLNKILILFCLSFIFSKTLIPTNGSSIILNKDKKEYIYYHFKKDGLQFNDLGEGYSNGDSVRIKFFIRAVTPSESKGKEDFKIKLKLNDKSSRTLRYIKPKSKLNIKGKYGRVPTQPGIWFVDMLASEFQNIKITGNKNIIVRSQISKINRNKYSSIGLNSINKESKYIIETKRAKGESKSSYWYKLSSKKNEYQFEVEGPTSIRIFTRLGNPSLNLDENNYTLFVKEDGLDIGTYSFNSDASNISYLKTSKEKVGKWKTCWINVPKGKHYYTVRRGDLSNKNKPIYLKVKQYDK